MKVSSSPAGTTRLKSKKRKTPKKPKKESFLKLKNLTQKRLQKKKAPKILKRMKRRVTKGALFHQSH